jgi:hypothetical protein
LTNLFYRQKTAWVNSYKKKKQPKIVVEQNVRSYQRVSAKKGEKE